VGTRTKKSCQKYWKKIKVEEKEISSDKLNPLDLIQLSIPRKQKMSKKEKKKARKAKI